MAVPCIGIDPGGDREARRRRAQRGGVAVEQDAHRDALHDLGEVAGGVLRRQHAELRAGGRGEAGDMAVEDVRPAARRPRWSPARPACIRASWFSLKLASTQRPCAGTMAINCAPIGGECAGSGAAVADHAVDRRAQFGVAEVQLRRVAIGECGLQRCLGLALLRVDHHQLLLGGIEGGARLVAGGDRLLVVGLGRCADWIDAAAVRGERLEAGLIVPRAQGFRVGGDDAGLGLADQGLLQPRRGVEVGKRRLLAGDHRLGAGERGAVVAVVELDQQVALMDRLVVGNRDLAMKPETFGASTVTSPPT